MSFLQTDAVPSVYDCSFEGLNFCQWSQAKDNDFDWQLRQVSGLGADPYVPTKDHTRGTSRIVDSMFTSVYKIYQSCICYTVFVGIEKKLLVRPYFRRDIFFFM